MKLTAKEFQTAFDQLNVQQAFVQQAIQQQAVLHEQQEAARRRAVAEELDRSWISEVAAHSTACEQAAANQTDGTLPIAANKQEWFRGLPGLGDQHDVAQLRDMLKWPSPGISPAAKSYAPARHRGLLSLWKSPMPWSWT